MKKSNPRKIITAVSMAFLMSNIPNSALAVSVSSVGTKMVSTGMVLAEMTRAEAEQNVRDYLQRSDIQSELIKHGVSADEATARLANLSELELRQISGQVNEARAGGDILVAILLVVLIIFLIQRI